MWDKVKELIGDAAPLIGSALGGPAGGAVGGMIASALGTKNDPDEIAAAIKQDPEALAKIKTVESNNKVKLQELAVTAEANRLEHDTKQQAQINKTMRAEYKADGIYKTGWRPMIGYMVALGMGGILAGLIYALFQDPSAAPKLISSATMVLTTMLGVLGVNIKKRSDDKAMEKGLMPRGIMSSIAERIAKGTKQDG